MPLVNSLNVQLLPLNIIQSPDINRYFPLILSYFLLPLLGPSLKPVINFLLYPYIYTYTTSVAKVVFLEFRPKIVACGILCTNKANLVWRKLENRVRVLDKLGVVVKIHKKLFERGREETVTK